MKRIGQNLLRQCIIQFLAFTGALLGLALAFISCTEERPLAPGPVSWRAYVAYTSLGKPVYSFIYIWDLDSVALIDSLPLEKPCPSMVASPSADAMFLLLGQNRKDMPTISRFSTDTWQLEWRSEELPPDWEWPWGDLHLLNGGDWIRYNRSILLTANGQVISVIPDSLQPLGGPERGTAIAVGRPLGGGGYSDIRRLDLMTGKLSGLYTPHLKSGQQVDGAYKGLLHEDQRRVLCYAFNPIGYNTWFLIGDLVTGETLFEDRLLLEAYDGEIIVTEDGNRAIVTEIEAMDIYDLGAMNKTKRFTGEDFSYELTGDPVPLLGHVVLLDADSRFIIGSDPGFYAYGFLHQVDLTSLQRISTVPGPLWEYAVDVDGFTAVPHRK